MTSRLHINVNYSNIEHRTYDIENNFTDSQTTSETGESALGTDHEAKQTILVILACQQNFFVGKFYYFVRYCQISYIPLGFRARVRVKVRVRVGLGLGLGLVLGLRFPKNNIWRHLLNKNARNKKEILFAWLIGQFQRRFTCKWRHPISRRHLCSRLN